MRTPLCAVVLVCATIAGLAAAQTPQPADPPPTSTAPPAPRDSALVKAAKKSGAAPKMPKKVITNKDVKRSKGKLTVKSLPPLPPEAAITTTNTDTRTPTEISDAQYHARKSAGERTAAAEKRVDELQKDLDAIEQAYYAEKDLNLRDDVIQNRFAQTKRQLEAARKELADSRDADGALAPKQ
jgi:hypothetical protein